MASDTAFTRKKFLGIVVQTLIGLAGLLGLGGLIRYFSHNPGTQQPERYDLGPIADFPKNGKLIRLDVPAVIYAIGNEFTAYSLTCTHLGCTLQTDADGFSCPCHGSEFQADGVVIRGPADENLPQLKIEIDLDNHLILSLKGDNS